MRYSLKYFNQNFIELFIGKLYEVGKAVIELEILSDSLGNV